MAAIQFGEGRQIISDDGQALNRAITADNVTSNQSSVRVNESAGGITRMTVGPNGNAEAVFSSRSASINMSEVNSGAEGLLGTATRFGSPVAPHDIRGSDLIRVPGMGEVTVEVAQRIGLLSSNPESGQAHQRHHSGNLGGHWRGCGSTR